VISIGDDGVQERVTTKSKRGRMVAVLTLEILREHKEPIEAMLSEVEGRAVRVNPGSLIFGGRPQVDLNGLRHTMITELLASGVDPRTVMGRAGHSSEKTTMTVDLDTLRTTLAQAEQQLSATTYVIEHYGTVRQQWQTPPTGSTRSWPI
jgi:hypothetical protein